MAQAPHPGQPVPRKGPPLIPTNTVTTKDGLTVRARIDPTLAVHDVVKQLCMNLRIPDNPLFFALRDDTDELVTDDNLRKKIRDKVPLKLISAPHIEAGEIIDKLSLRDERTLRFSLFTLQKYIKEEQFATEFLHRDGLRELIDIINTTIGNTLAYALTGMQNLMELERGWSNLDTAFIYKVVQILANPNNLINVCRPASAILKKLVEADPRRTPDLLSGSGSRGGPPPVPQPGSVYRFGFNVVWEQMKREQGLLDIVVNRLGSADSMMGLYSMMLINSLISHATEAYWDEFTSEIERLNVPKAVERLMSSHTIEDLTSSILDFQANMVRVVYRRKTTQVDPEDDEVQTVLNTIWRASKVDEMPLEMYGSPRIDPLMSPQLNGHPKVLSELDGRWWKLGFGSDDLRAEFKLGGMLALDCLKQFVLADQEKFAQQILEQNSRSLERRCPIAQASNEVVEILSEHWQVFAVGYSTSTTFQPFFLSFYRVHNLALQFFIRMWGDSGATGTDFIRVASLVASQVKVALRRENERPWHEVEHDFVESEYRAVRDRQMRELELEDDLLNKVPVRNLRAKLYKESYEFVRQQRIACLFQGAWFVNGIPLSSSQQSAGGTPRKPNRPWRYMRLDRNMRYIHYVDSGMKFPVRSGNEDLPDKIEISQIAEIARNTCALPPNVSLPMPSLSHDALALSPLPISSASPLSFSLLSARGGETLGDHVATDVSRWADWTDGLNMLRKDGLHVATEETAGFVHALTEIGLKIKLLDLSGERVDIPSSLVAGPPPSNTDFFFSDL